MRHALGHALDLLTTGLGSLVCNITKYVDSLGKIILVPFIVKAPVNLRGDHIQSEEFPQVDLSLQTTTWKFNFMFTGVIDAFEYFLEVASSVGLGNQIIACYLNSGNITTTWKSTAGVTIGNTVHTAVNPQVGEWLEFTITSSPTSFDVTVNGITLTDTTLALAESLAGVETYGARTGGAFEPDVLMGYSMSTLTGNISYVSRSVDGTVFITDNGTVMKLNKDTSGDEQYPNYQPPASVISYFPETGPVKCNGDYISNLAIGSKVFSTTDFIVSGEFTPYNLGLGEFYFNYGRNGGADLGIYAYSSGTGVIFGVQDNLGITAFEHYEPNMHGLRAKYRLERVGTNIDVYVNDVFRVGFTLLDLTTNGLTIDSVVYGAKNNTSNKSRVTYYNAYISSDNFTDRWNFISRLGAQSTPLTTFTGSISSTALTISDGSPYGMIFPHIVDNGSYLLSDDSCANNPLVIDELTGIAVINELTNQFVINEVV